MSPGRPRKLNDLAVKRLRAQKTPVHVIALAFGVTDDAVKKSIQRSKGTFGPTVADQRRVLKGLRDAVRSGTELSSWLEEADWVLGT